VPSPKPKLAPLWPRAGAAVLDAIAIGAIVAALVTVALRAGHSEPSAGAVVAIGSVIAGCLYGPLLMARRGEQNGQTWGKQLLGLRVMPERGGAMTFWLGLGREALGKQLLAILTGGLYIPFDYAWALWDPERQALHDKVADTLVVVAESRATVVEGLPPPDTSPRL
jgi:uncharacterized RDD family membrane protein YckC